MRKFLYSGGGGWKPKKFVNYLIFLVLFIVLSFFIYAYAGAFSYTSPVVCDVNCSGQAYELFNHTSTYCEANPIPCFNTINDCKDGSLVISNVRQGSPYEWVDNITVTNLNASNFTGGDTVNIHVQFDCDYNDDKVSFNYHNGSGWINIFNADCVEDFIDDFEYNYTLHKISGNHTIRAVIVYGGTAGMICGYDYDNQYSDTDDVSFYVYSDYEINSPQVSNVKPVEGQTYELILPKTIHIQADITDDTAVDAVLANITWGSYQEIIQLSELSGNTWSGDFESVNITGRYNVTIIANDTNSNINDTQTTFFYLNKTANITVSSPINEKWYANYTFQLEYIIEFSGNLTWAGYKLNSDTIVILDTPVTHQNNISEAPKKYANNTLTSNVSQSFNLTENMIIHKIKLSMKRVGNAQNITLQIRNDSNNKPQGAVLGEVNLTTSISNQSFEWVPFNLTTGLSLQKDTKYWVFLTPNGSVSGHTLFETNNDTYARGQLLSNTSQDLLFMLFDKYHYKKNLTAPTEINNITVYANFSGESQLIYSPTVEFNVDRFGPSFENLGYTPASQVELDPKKQINVSVEITDESNVSSAVLQYKLSSEPTWNNISMTNTSTNYWATFTPSLEGNWSIRILANDTVSNSNTTNITTIEVLYEFSYSLDSTQFLVVSSGAFYSSVSLGNITINNTGDKNITFLINKSATTVPLTFFNNQSFLNQSVSSGQTYKINITATTLGFEAESEIQIQIIPNETDTIPQTTTLNTTLVTFDGPYLLVLIDQYSSSVIQGDKRVIFSAKIANSGNETIDNITLTWSIPSGWSSDNNLTKNVSVLYVGEEETYAIFTEINPDAPTGTFQVTIAATSLKANNSDSKTVTVSALSTPPAGGGSSTVTKTVTSIIEVGTPELDIGVPDSVEMVRGQSVEFIVNITNNEKRNITNITVDIGGFLSSYTEIEPYFIEVLNLNELVNVSIKLTSPAYLSEGKYQLNISLKYPWKKKTAASQKQFELIITTADTSSYALCVLEAEKSLLEIKKQGFNTEMLEVMLYDSKQLLTERSYELSLEKCNELTELITSAKESKKSLNNLYEMKEGYGVTSKSIDNALNLANEAIERGDFLLAQKRVKDAALLFEIERSSLWFKIKNLFKKTKDNWEFVLAGFIILSLLSIFSYSRLSINFSNKKLELLKKEEDSIIELVKKAQVHRFTKKEISKRIYDRYMDGYRKRLAKIQDEKNTLRLRILGLKGRTRRKTLTDQIEELNNFKRDLQKKYYVKKIIDEKSYHRMMNQYDNMISSLEEKLHIIKQQGHKKHEKKK